MIRKTSILLFVLLLLPVMDAAAQNRPTRKALLAENEVLRFSLDSLQTLLDSLESRRSHEDSLLMSLYVGNEPEAEEPEFDYTPEVADSLLQLWYRSYAISDFDAVHEYDMDSVRFTSDVSDCVMLAVAERHKGTGHIGKCYLAGYGLKKGAIATSISHDNHNLIVAGKNTEDMAVAANCVRDNNGGLAVAVDGKVVGQLALPLAGLMCDSPIEDVSSVMDYLHERAAELGVNPNIDPFMTLGFVALTVIPSIRLTTKGIYEV